MRLLWCAVWMVLCAAQAHAFPWMIEHGYTGCNECHVDPSGGSVLNDYGRAQSEILVRSKYGKTIEEAGPAKDFLWGVALPDGLQLQPEFRGMLLPTRSNDTWVTRFLVMQADMKAAVDTPTVVASASFGVVSEGARGALITQDQRPVRVVSREYWAGARVGKSWILRGGRMNLPFGLRTDQHILFTRNITRTDGNDDQQVGLSAAYNGRNVRSEWMAIAGNFQISGDAFRERGYSGYAAFAASRRAEVGVSSLVTRAQQSLDGGGPLLRQAHGVFSRVSPVDRFGIFAEANVLANTTNDETRPGVVAGMHIDGEVTEGLHLKLGTEVCQAPAAVRTDGRGWFAMQWFAAPHVELRTDVLYGPMICGVESAPHPAMGLQLHVYL